ncbi:MAG TPA: protein kinase [Candidatus Eisenbacteria bacterium]|jgi:serine/threonine-protein kinase
MLQGPVPPSGSTTDVGRTLSHFRILEQIGEGGMGVVYRARDERLEREVALKLLPAGVLASQDERSRSRLEARTLSRLNHPAIATLYDLGEEGGRDFLVMEFVEGETLERKLALGALAEREIAAIGEQIAAALQAAHEQQVVHCDLKPGNVMVTPRGQVKVLDFGIARLLRVREEGRPPAPTLTPAAAGTLPYMAPEQLLEGRVDARTDLYALGVVLYHMAAGRLPFENGVALVLANQIINTPPPPPARFRSDLSPRLEELILKCLEKDPANRYQNAADLAVDLRRAGAPPRERAEEPLAPARIESLAVLPLANLSGDPAQEFFADGMTESLIATLAQIGALRVISRTSVMQYKGARKPLPEIARALRVDAVVEGSVFRAGDRVRITVQLIEAASDRHLWAHSYESPLDDVLALQSDVATHIAEEVRVKLSPGEQQRLSGKRVVNPRAYEAYLRGRHAWSKRIESELRRSVGFFQQAIDADPTYAPGYAGLADAYNILADVGTLAPLEAASRARAATSRALELDPRLAEAHTSRAFIRFFFDWDWEGAERAFREAIDLNPGYATAHQWHAELLAAQARFDEALTAARRAESLDPLAFIIGTTVGDVFYFWRRYDEAIEQLRRVIVLQPTFAAAHNDLARALVQAGRPEEAIEEFLAAAELSGGDPRSHAGLAHAYALAGRTRDARDVLQVLTERARNLTVSSHAIAVIHIGLGEHQRAIEWLDRACREHDRALVWLKVHPRLDPLRSHPLFDELLRRVGFAR